MWPAFRRAGCELRFADDHLIACGGHIAKKRAGLEVSRFVSKLLGRHLRSGVESIIPRLNKVRVRMHCATA